MVRIAEANVGCAATLRLDYVYSNEESLLLTLFGPVL